MLLMLMKGSTSASSGGFRGVLKVLGGFGCIRACTDLTGHSVRPYKFRGTFRVDQGASGYVATGLGVDDVC